MMDWTPIPPDTPLDQLFGINCYADDTAGRALALLAMPLPRTSARRQPEDRVLVTTHTTWGFPRHRQVEMPGYVPVSGACVARGLVPRRVIATPEPIWPLIPRQPSFPTPDGMVTLAELARHGIPASVRRRGALAAADRVKTTYGRMLADVAYRIEQSALFDPEVPTTRSFTNALAVWNDTDVDSAAEDDVVRLAGTLKLAFDTARAHAETVGLDHLPATARADARRAAGAARLAVGATSDAERAAAQQQVVRILRSLALYHLPDPDHVTPQLTDGR